MTNIAIGYLQSLGADIYHATIQAPFLESVVIVGVISGVALIVYDVISNRKKGIADDIIRHLQKEELDQIDRQNNERNEGHDRYTPANIK